MGRLTIAEYRSCAEVRLAMCVMGWRPAGPGPDPDVDGLPDDVGEAWAVWDSWPRRAARERAPLDAAGLGRCLAGAGALDADRRRADLWPLAPATWRASH